MNTKKYLKQLIIERPLLFLCGPNININELNNKETKDRRALLYQFINKKFHYKNMHAIPVIVDSIFSNDNIEKFNLQTSLLEEITAAVSYRTYIYLDSMSASYEFGQFTNSKEKNSIVILLEKQFEKRKRKDLGEYIKTAISQSARLIPYTAKYSDKEKEYISFRGKRLAIEIQRLIKSDLENFIKNESIINIEFIKGQNSAKLNNEILYYLLKNELILNVDLKTMFYLVVWAFEKADINITNRNPNPKEDIKKISNLISETLLKSLVIQEKEFKLLTENRKIRLVIDDYKGVKSKSIFEHLYYFIYLIYMFVKGSKLPGKQKITVGSVYKELQVFAKETPNFQNIFGLSNSEFAAMKNYPKNMNDYVHKKDLLIHNKLRHLVTYNHDYNGMLLRSAHEKISKGLTTLLPMSSSVFSYRPNVNTAKCVKEHVNSNNFVKLDISKYFDNISKLILKIKIKNYMNSLPLMAITYMEGFNDFYNSMFYKRGNMPIGFVTSPILSNFYLYELDERIKAEFPSVKYTRYADDILLSGEMDQLEGAKLFISNYLQNYKLYLNNKTIQRTLNKPGDSIKFLGITIVKTKSNNDLRISKTHLIKASKVIINYLENYIKGSFNIDQYNKANGLAAYIKSISEFSFTKLKKMVVAKTNIEITVPLIR